MMMPTESYIDSLSDRHIDELILERERLLASIHEFEKSWDEPEEPDPLQTVSTVDPEFIYQMNLEYLAALCLLISRRYSERLAADDMEGGTDSR